MKTVSFLKSKACKRIRILREANTGTFRKCLLMIHFRRLAARLLGLLGCGRNNNELKSTPIHLASQEENCSSK
jgi:hypothetical protein